MPGLTGFGSPRGADSSEPTDSSWAARRIQAIAATNPELAADPAALLSVALNGNVTDGQLVGTAATVTGEAELRSFITNLRAAPAKEQLQWWNKLATPAQQQTLVAAGYNPRASDLLALGALGLTESKGRFGQVTGGVVDAWDWGKQQVDTVTPDQIERPFDFARHTAGAGITKGFEGLNYPFAQAQRGINTALHRASVADTRGLGEFFTGWGESWRISGTDENFRAQAVEQAQELIAGDPLLYEAAVAQANGQDPVDFLMEKYGYEPQTTELAQAHADFLARQQRLEDPSAFGEAVKTLAFNRATFGQDVANLLGLEGGSKAFTFTAAGADLALAFRADPLLVFGRARVLRDVRRNGLVYRATNGARDAVDGLNPLLRSINDFRGDRGVVRKFNDVTGLWQRVKAGDQEAFRRFVQTEREFARAIPAWVQWEARGNRLESADDLFDWFTAAGEGGGLQPLVGGWFRKARHRDLVLPRYTSAGEAFARTKLATLGRLDLAADRKRIVGEVNRLGEGFAAQHLSPDQIRAVQNGTFVGLGDKLMAPLANLGKRVTLQTRRSTRGLILDDSAEFFAEIERWIDEGHTAGQSFIRRNQFLSDMLLAPNVEQRRVLASAYMQDMAEASGVLHTQAGREFWSRFLDHDNQAYTWDGWDKIRGSGRRVAVLPNMQTSTAIAVPSFGELAHSVAQTHLMGLFTKLNADGVSVALSRFWKVPVLLRLGFIPRAAGEEYLSFMLARPEEARAYLRATIAAQPAGAIFLPAKPFLLPLRATSKVLGRIHTPTGRLVGDATEYLGRMISTPFAGPVRWWARRGADERIVETIKDWDLYETLAAQGVTGRDMVRALEDAGRDPYMVRAMVEGFADVSAQRAGLTALLGAEDVAERGGGLPIEAGRRDLFGEFVPDRSRYVAYPNVAAPTDEAKRAALDAGLDLADSGADFFPAMFVHRNEELWREGAVRNALEELSRRYIGPRVEREMAVAWGAEGAEGRAAFDEFRAAWGRLDEPVRRQVAAVFKRDRVDPNAVDQLAARHAGDADATRVIGALRHEGVSANTIEAALGDLRDGHLVFDQGRAREMFKGRIAAELQDPANRDSVEQMVRAFTDSRGRHVAAPVADGQTPLYGLVADVEAHRALARAMAEAGGRKPNPGDWPVVSGSRDLPAFDQHWADFHDARDVDLLDLAGAYADGGATHVPLSAWATHDHRRAQALKDMLEEQYHLTGRLSVGHVNVETRAAREGVGTPIAPGVVHRVEGGAANDLYRLGPDSLPSMQPLTEGQVVDWARAVDDTTVARIIRLADEDPEAFDRLMAAARADFHTRHVAFAGGTGHRNPAAMSRDAFVAEPEHAVLDRAGQELNRHFGRDWDLPTYAGKSYDAGIAQAAYREHDEYLDALAAGLRAIGRNDLADDAVVLRERLLGADRPSVTMVEGPPEGALHAVRYDQPERYVSPEDKPQGVYHSIVSDFTATTPHAGEGMAGGEAGARRFEQYVKPSRPLEFTEAPIASPRRGAELPGPAGAGMHAAKALTPEFADLVLIGRRSKAELIERLRQDYPSVDWSVYAHKDADAQDVLEGLGGHLAREAGYDAIILRDPQMPEFDEIAVLKGSAFVQPTRRLVTPDLPAYEDVVREVAAAADLLHSLWLDDAVRAAVPGIPDDVRAIDWMRSHAAEQWDDIAAGGAPSVERLIEALPTAERPLAEALLGQLARFAIRDSRGAALQRSVLDPLGWARGDDAPAWARTFADELALVHRGEITGSLEQTLARRATLPTPGVMPGELFDDWAEIIARHVEKLLFTRDGELLHAVTQPALRGHTGLDVLARVDSRDLPDAITGPSLQVRPDEPLGFGERFDNLTGRMFNFIGGEINRMARKPLYISNYVRESAVNPHLMDALIDKGWKSEAVSVIGADRLDDTADVWRMLTDVDVRATRARAREQVFTDAVAKLADQLHGEGRLDDYRAILDRLLGLAPQDRVALGRHFDNVTHARKVVADAAKTRAVGASVPFIDDHHVRSQYAGYMRNLQPFFYAEEQFYKRWVRTLAMRPEAIQRGQQIFMGIRHAGVVHRDENGEWVFTYPGSAEGLHALTKALGVVGIKANMPVDMALTGNVRRTLPGVGSFGAPGWSPLVTVPVGALAMVLPEAAGFDLLNRVTSGPWANRGLTDRVVPTNYARLWAAATHDPEKDPQMASAMFQAVQHLAANGQVPDGSDPAEVQVFLDRARNWARTQLVWRAAFGFIGPASPSNALDDDGLNEEARRLIGALGMEEGLAELMRRHPDHTTFDVTAQGVSQTQVPSRAPLPALATTQQWLDDNEALVKAFPNAGLFLMPPVEGDNAFDIEAYYHQLANGYRVRRSLDDTWREIIFRRDAPRYFDTVEGLDRALTAAETPAARQTIRALRVAFGEQYRKTHPVFAEKLLASEAEEQRNVTIAELERLMADPTRLPVNETTRQINLLWESFQRTRGTLARLRHDQTDLGAKKKRAVREGMVEWGNAYARQNPAVRALWERVLRAAVEA